MRVTKKQAKILDYVDKGLTQVEIAKLLDVSPYSIRDHLRALKKNGLVDRESFGRWFVTRKGIDALPLDLPISEKRVLIIRLVADQGLKVKEAAERLGLTRYGLARHLTWLVKHGHLKRVSQGKYQRASDVDRGVMVDLNEMKVI